MLIREQFALGGESAQRLLLPDRHVVVDIVDHLGREDEEPGIDRTAVSFGLFKKARDAVAVHIERAEAARRHGRGQGRQLAVSPMEIDGRGDVDVADAVPVGHAEGLLALQMLAHPQQAPPSHRGIAGVDQRHLPGLGPALVHLHPVLAHVEGHVGHVQEVVREILLDDVALVAAADHEIVDAVGGVDLHDVPQDGAAADLDHRLGPDGGFFAEARPKSAGEYDCFHGFRDQ